MSDSTSSSGGKGLYFIVGALVVVVAVLGYMAFGGQMPWDDSKDVNINVTLPDGGSD